MALMKVNGYGIVKPGSSARRSSSTSSSTRFSDILSVAQAEGAAAASEVSDIAATASLGGLLALQEISEEEKRRQRLVKQGKNMLDRLEDLRQKLLIGEIPASMLPSLEASLAAEKEGISDPRLLMIIEDIELRVAVELAKLEMAFASQAEI
jgi:hypothetical protein